MASDEFKWRYDFSETTEDKRVSANAVDQGRCVEIVGADMRVQGRLRPHPGLKLVTRIRSAAVDSDPTSETGGPSYGPQLTAVTDFFPVTFLRGTDTQVRGWVVRGTHSGSGTVVFVYWNDGGTWESRLVEFDNSALNGSGMKTGRKGTGTRVSASASVAGRMSVTVHGRLIYIFREGRQPFVFYLDPTDSNPRLVTDTGPGARPEKPVVEFFETPTLPAENTGAALTVDPGGYSFAYQFRDSATGRISALSEIATIKESDFVTSGNSTVRPLYVRIGLSGVDANVDAKWNQIRIYRSVRVEVAGGTFVSSVLFLEATYTVGDTSLGTLFHYVSTADLALPGSAETYDNSAQFMEDMPFAGAATVYQGLMVTGSQTQVGDEAAGVGQINWSTPLSVSPEAFPPDNRFVSNRVYEAPIVFAEVDDALIGFSGSLQFMLYRTGGVVNVRPVHRGYGVVSNKAVTVYENAAYAVTKHGLVTVDYRGQMTPINALDRLLIEEWGSSIGNVWASHDSKMGCVTLWNATLRKGVVLWATTRAVSELEDMNFAAMADGLIPGETSDEERTMFVTATGQVFKYDADRSKTGLAGAQRYSWWDVGGAYDVAGRVTAVTTAARVVEVETLAGAGPAWPTTSTDWKDAPVVFLKPDGTVRSYSRFRVDTADNSTDELVVQETLTSADVHVGDTVLVGAVAFRARGWPLHYPTVDRSAFYMDQFKSRFIDVVGAHFEDVGGALSADEEVAHYAIRVYRGNSGTPSADAAPLNGQGTLVTSVQRPQPGDDRYARVGSYGVAGAVVIPEVVVWAVDLDFGLLGLTASGTIEPHDNDG